MAVKYLNVILSLIFALSYLVSPFFLWEESIPKYSSLGYYFFYHVPLLLFCIMNLLPARFFLGKRACVIRNTVLILGGLFYAIKIIMMMKGEPHNGALWLSICGIFLLLVSTVFLRIRKLNA